MLTNKETEILELYILGLASDEQIKIVEDRLSSDVDYKNEYENLLALKQALKLYDKYKEKKEYLKSLNKEKVGERFNIPTVTDIHTNSKSASASQDKETLKSLTINYKRILAVAASIVLLIGIGYIIKTDFSETEIEYAAPSPVDTLATDSLKTDTIKNILENPFNNRKRK